MLTTLSRTIRIALVLAAPVTGAPAVRADGDDDQERVRAAREAGRILPLAGLLTRLQAELPGVEVLEVELEEERGRFVYEIKLLHPGGRLAELDYDAATGARLVKGKD